MLKELAANYLDALGGKDNIEELSCYGTRLSVKVKKGSIVKAEEIKELGALGLIRLNRLKLQIVLGTEAEIIFSEMSQELKEGTGE